MAEANIKHTNQHSTDAHLTTIFRKI